MYLRRERKLRRTHKNIQTHAWGRFRESVSTMQEAMRGIHALRIAATVS